MKSLARSFIWWPGMDKEIESRVKSCSLCNMNQSKPNKAPVHAWEYPAKAWERIHLDFAGPFMGKMFLVLVDAYSKWVEVECMSSITASALVKCLRKIFASHGLPQVVVNDNGPSFVSEEFKIFLRRNGIKQLFSAPYHPESNGQAERAVRTFKEAMKVLKHGDIDTKLARLLFNYRITPHTTTGRTPAELLLKRELRSAFHLLRPDQKLEMKGKQWEMERMTDCKTRLRTFSVNELVWVRNFGLGHKWVKGRVIKMVGAVTYDVMVEQTDSILQRHVDQLLRREEGTVRFIYYDIYCITFQVVQERAVGVSLTH